jgi:hypothetical protein
MDKRILIPLIIAVLLALGGYYLTIEDKTTTTTTLQQITSTTSSPTTTRAITRPTQPTTTNKQTTTTLPGTSTTSTTIPSSTNATTTSTTATTQPDHTNPQTTTTTTIIGATTNPTTTTTIAGTTSTSTTQISVTTTIPGAITTSTIQSSTTTLPGATTTSISATTTSGATTTRTTTTRITTTTTTTRTTTTTTTSTTQPALSGLVIHLKFDESAGTTAYDSSGSNDGSLVNGPTWTTGRSGNGIRLDSVNDYVDADNSASLDITGPMTIMLWIKPAAAQETCSPGAGSNRGVASKVNAASGSSTWSWQLRYGSPTSCALGFHFSDPVNGERWVSVIQALTSGQWYHVTATFDGSTVRSYLNGVMKESKPMSSIQSNPSTKIIIGSDGWGNYFSGSVDDFRIYRRTLSATEINQIISAAGATTTTPSTTTTTIQTTTTTTTKATTTTTRTTTTTTRTTTTTAGGPIIGGVQVYPRDHIWNTPVDKLPLDSKSATYISAAGSSANLYVYTGYYLNTADKNTPKYYLNFRYRSDAGPYSIPPNPLIETRSSDHALFVLEKDSKVFYQIFDAVKNSDGTWGTCGSGAVFDLSTYVLRPDGWTSDAAGLNFLPGLLTYDEVASGEIKHALRITTWNSQNKHIWPARHDAGIADTSLPPMGQRFRLKASFDISKYTPQQQVILRAMKKYGMMLADNSGNKNIWGLSAVADSRWDFDYTTFTGIHGSDFEAVDVSSLMIDPNSGQARQL